MKLRCYAEAVTLFSQQIIIGKTSYFCIVCCIVIWKHDHQHCIKLDDSASQQSYFEV